MSEPKIGDSTNYPLTAQRLDKVDLEDTSRLLEDTILRQEGQLMGAVGGLMSRVSFTYDSTSEVLTLGACRLFASHYASGSTTLTDGGVFEYRPALDANPGAISLAPLGTTAGWVFFKRIVVAADEENRAYFDALDQTKKVGLALTRQREAIEFVVSNSYTGYARASGYFPFLHIEGFFLGAVSVIPIYAWEAFDTLTTNTGAASGLLFSQASFGLGIQQDGTTMPASLPMILRFLAGSLQHVYDQDYTLDPLTGLPNGGSNVAKKWTGFNLPRGLWQLDEDLSTAETTLTSVQTDATSTSAFVGALLRTAPLFTAMVPVGPSPSVTYATLINPNPYPTVTTSRSTTGRMRFTFPSALGITSTTSAVTVTAVEGNGRVCCTYIWDSTYELSVYSYNDLTSLDVNAAMSVVIHNVNNPIISVT
jgi:hypothetical protein